MTTRRRASAQQISYAVRLRDQRRAWDELAATDPATAALIAAAHAQAVLTIMTATGHERAVQRLSPARRTLVPAERVTKVGPGQSPENYEAVQVQILAALTEQRQAVSSATNDDLAAMDTVEIGDYIENALAMV